MIEIREIRPQRKQELFLSTPADFALMGGGAGGGKSWALMLECMRHKDKPGFGAVVFRRTSPQITNPGGLWDESTELFPLVGAMPYNSPPMHWTFPSGAKVVMTHLQHEKNVIDWQGSQVGLFCWDELAHFTRKQFFYMFSRSRNARSGLRPYVRATCNPVPPGDPVGGWLHEFVGWYIDQNTGYAIPERSGVIRWFVNVNSELHWAGSKEELTAAYPDIEPKSFTFIHSLLEDNKILMDNDPGYLANLQGLDLVEQEQLLRGNWLIKPAAGLIFNENWFEIVEAVPAGGHIVRFWDLAATEKELAKDDPDYTASCLMKVVDDIYYVLDATAEQMGPARTDKAIYNTATQDGKETPIRFEREGGASGKRDSRTVATMLDGWSVAGIRPQGDKLVRAKGLSAQALAGNVKLLRGAWNKRWLAHMHGQPELAHDDEMDAASGAYNELQRLKKKWTAGSRQG